MRYENKALDKFFLGVLAIFLLIPAVTIIFMGSIFYNYTSIPPQTKQYTSMQMKKHKIETTSKTSDNLNLIVTLSLTQNNNSKDSKDYLNKTLKEIIDISSKKHSRKAILIDGKDDNFVEKGLAMDIKMLLKEKNIDYDDFNISVK